MYKLLLCWRYLRTRYIALVSIISVTLGVGVMIVVNSVMEGFTIEMQNRIHGILADVLVSSVSFDGMYDATWHEQAIRRAVGDDIEAMAPTVIVPAMLQYSCGGSSITCPVQLIGIDEKTQSAVNDFGQYLQHPANRQAMSFELRDGGYDVLDHQSSGEAHERKEMDGVGWPRRKLEARTRKFRQDYLKKSAAAATASPAQDDNGIRNPFPDREPAENLFDPEKQQYAGAVVGIAMASFRSQDGEDHFRLLPGDDVQLTLPTVGQPPKGISQNFTIVDLYESKMSENDSSFVFVPIRKLQDLRGMFDPTTGVTLFNTMQIKLKPGVDGNKVRDKLNAAFNPPGRPQNYVVETWRDRRAPILAAVWMEKAILNVLLFLIITVAGFGILAIFYMIVVEKTRDIGILKSLGASGRGVMGIFLAYGLSLGLVGSGVGLASGLLFVRYINEIADGLGRLTGHPVFDPTIYYFYKIPAIVVPGTVAWIVIGALGIAVAASILPARRAARLHPVEALRYDDRLEEMLAQPPTRLRPAHADPVATHHEPAALQTVDLYKSYRKGSIEVPVLRGVSMTVRQGELLAIVGQSGSGKSTVLHLLGTLDAPDRGEIHYAGQRIDDLPVADRDALRNRQFGMIFQFYHLLPELSTLENVLAPLMIAHGIWSFLSHRRRHRRRAEELLDLVGLGHRMKHRPRELSGGEMQRAAIARALVAEPELLLADEPTGNLDQTTGQEIIHILRSLNQQRNLTIVMVTHDRTIADQADRIVRLSGGRIED